MRKMLNSNLFFIFLFSLGALIIYPLTPRYFSQTKKFWLTVGAVLLHIGLYGVLWLHLVHVITISLFLIEGGTFVLWDPLTIFGEPHRKLYRLIGNLLIISGAILSVSYYTSFPFWPWAIPAIGFLLPFLIPPLHAFSKPILTVSTLLVLVYGSLIGYRIYQQVTPKKSQTPTSMEMPAIEGTVPPPLELAAPQHLSPPVPTGGPLSDMIREGDEKLKGLENENTRLKTELENLQNQIKENQEKIEELKKVVNQL